MTLQTLYGFFIPKIILFLNISSDLISFSNLKRIIPNVYGKGKCSKVILNEIQISNVSTIVQSLE